MTPLAKSLTSIPPERERAWRELLTLAHSALERDLLTGNALALAVKAFDFANPGIPTRLLPAVLQRSMKLRDKNGQPIYWDARAVSIAYDEYLAEREGQGPERDESHLLPDNAAAACQRCFGKGLEFMPGGGVRPGCKHEPLTDEDRREFEEAAQLSADEIREQIEHARKAMSMTPNVGRVPLNVPAKPKGKILVCQSCGHEWDTYFHPFNVGDVCGFLLNRHEDPTLCKGILAEAETATV